MSRMQRRTGVAYLALGIPFLVALPLSLSVWTYWPWEKVTVTTHYDVNGVLIGVEGVGVCGFSRIGDAGASAITQTYACNDFREIPMPF